MSDEGGAEMTAASAAPLDDSDLLGQILLRISPLPSSLPRASVVSKRWELLATAPGFHRRFIAHHRKPPILGYFEQLGRELVFSSVLDPPDRIPSDRFTLGVRDVCTSWILLGCRHGRVLISIDHATLLVFDPISGVRHFVDVPLVFRHHACTVSGAVLCAAGDDQGHVHGDCHLSPFKVVLVSTSTHEEAAIAQVYSSETGMWGHLVSTAEPCAGIVRWYPCTLTGNALYWWLNESQDEMLEFDLDVQRLALVKRPTSAGIRHIRIIRAEGGGVGIAELSYPSFQIWGRKVSSTGIATWVLHKTVNIQEIIGVPSGIKTRNESIVGYSEDADAVFLSVSSNMKDYAFIVELESMKSRELNQRFLEYSYHPFTNFYTPGPVRARSTAPAIEPPPQ